MTKTVKEIAEELTRDEYDYYAQTLALAFLEQQKLLDHLLDEAVERWHETDSTETRTLPQWLGITDESFGKWAVNADPAELVPLERKKSQ